MKGERKNMERMEEYVQDYYYQSLQQFVSDSLWDHGALIERIGKDVDALLGGEDSMLLIDESGFAKKGKKSVGVARQWWAVCVIDSDTTERKFFLSSAPASTLLTELVGKHACRYWIERTFQDAKTSVGMADYQARGWLA